MTEDRSYPIRTPRQLKDWINNMAKKNNLVANTVLQNYIMERLLERISISKYRDNFILKGGFLISAMVGINARSTMDMDTTVKGLPVSKEEIERILNEILMIDIGDQVSFMIRSIKNIHDVSEYEDFRITMIATFFTMRVTMKLDITTGDVIIPREVEYSFKLMFENRSISVMAYNLNTILAEKIESILTRNVSNTRARDYYDVFVLLTDRYPDVDMDELRKAIVKKAEERNSVAVINQPDKYLKDIRESIDLQNLWIAYQDKYTYAKDIRFEDVVACIERIFWVE